MASPGQSPFALYFTLASVALSVVAFTTAASNDVIPSKSASKRKLRRKEAQTRPQPQRRQAADGLHVETTLISDVDAAKPVAKPAELQTKQTADQIIQDHQDELAAAISQTAKVSRALRAQSVNGHNASGAAVQKELSLVASRLCRLQQELIIDPEAITTKEGFNTSFESSIRAIESSLSTLETDLRDAKSSHHAMDKLEAQLRGQQPALESLLGINETLQLPPTPPSDAVPNSSVLMKQRSPDRTPQPSPRLSCDTGVTPSASRFEPPSEYLPPLDAPDDEAPSESAAVEPLQVEAEQSAETDHAPESEDHLYIAVTDDDGEALDRLLSRGLNPMAQFGELQRTALHQAAHLNRVDCLKTLLQHGATMGAEDAKGDTALHLAAWVGNVEAISALLAHGADVDRLSGRDGYSPLWCAVSAHQLVAARLLLRHGAQAGLRASTGGGLMPLHQAAVTGQGAMCELLLDHGALVNCVDDDRSTPLHYAAVSGSVPALTALLRCGADIEARQLHGLTAVHWAAHKGHVDALAALLDYGARLHPQAGDGATPLHLAASRGHAAAAQLLISRGAKKKAAHASWAGVAGTPADMAEAKGHVELARMLRA